MKIRMNKSRLKQIFLGNQERGGLPGKIMLLLLLCGVGFIFLYPILRFISTSGKSVYDIVNPLVYWVPTRFEAENYRKAFLILGGIKSLWQTSLYMSIVGVIQTLISAVVAYGFAKYNFWGKKIFFVLMAGTFFVPGVIPLLPQYILFHKYNIVNSILPLLLPALFGQGIKNALFILIFYQFFKMSPKSLDEAASIDGAGQFKIFALINLRMAAPAIIVVLVFSFVWNWNDVTTADTYFGDAITTVPLALQRFADSFLRLYPQQDATSIESKMSKGIEMAGTVLSIIPLMALYVIIERRLIESIDKSGITGE